MRIIHRVALGFSAVIATTVAVGFVGWTSVEGMSRGFERNTQTQMMADALADARSAEANFRLTGSAASAEAVAEATRRLRRTVEQRREEGGEDPLLGAIQASEVRYSQAFADWVVRRQEKERHIAAMAEAAALLADLTRNVGVTQTDAAAMSAGEAAGAHSNRLRFQEMATATRAAALIGAAALRAERRFARLGRPVDADTARSLLEELAEVASRIQGMTSRHIEGENADRLAAFVDQRRALFDVLISATQARAGAAAQQDAALAAVQTTLAAFTAATERLGAEQSRRVDQLLGAGADAGAIRSARERLADIHKLSRHGLITARLLDAYPRDPTQQARTQIAEEASTVSAAVLALRDALPARSGEASIESLTEAIAAILTGFDQLVVRVEGHAQAIAAEQAAQRRLRAAAYATDRFAETIERGFLERAGQANQVATEKGKLTTTAMYSAAALSALALVTQQLRVGTLEFLLTEHLADEAPKVRQALRAVRMRAAILQEELGEQGSAMSAFDEHLLSYGDEFEQVITNIEAQNTAAAEMDAAATAVTAAVADAVARQSDEIYQIKRLSRRAMEIGSVLAVLLGAGIATVLATRTSRPIRTITETMQRLARNELDIEIPNQNRTDEIGEMAQAVVVFRENARARRTLEQRQEQERGQRERQLKSIETAVDGFRSHIARMVLRLTEASERMRGNAHTLTETAEENGSRAGIVAAAAEQSAMSMQTAAGATEEMSQSIRSVSEQVIRSREIAETARLRATDSAATVNGLAEAAERIGEVVELINTIAEQTNLLALNATIEAARAGEAGRGFAVVANEVKHLAGRTARATEEIQEQIGAVQDRTRSAVEAMQSITTIIADIGTITGTIVRAIDEQTVATGDIARNVNEAASGAQEVARTIEGVRAGTEQTRDASAKVLDVADAVTEDADQLRQEVDRFLHAIEEGDAARTGEPNGGTAAAGDRTDDGSARHAGAANDTGASPIAA